MFEDYTETDADELHKTFREETKEEKELKEFDFNLNNVDRRSLFKNFVAIQEHIMQVENDLKLCGNVLKTSEELLALENKVQKHHKIGNILLGAIGGNALTMVAVCAEKAMNYSLDIPSILAQQGAMIAGGAMAGYLYYKVFKQEIYEQEKKNNMDWINANKKRVCEHQNRLKHEEYMLHKKCNILQKHIEAANTKEMINKEGIFQVVTQETERKM